MFLGAVARFNDFCVLDKNVPGAPSTGRITLQRSENQETRNVAIS